MKLRWVLLVALALALVMGSVYLWGLPRLTEYSPADGAEGVQAGTSLRLTFSEPVQAETVVQRLTTDPPRQASYQWQGNTLLVSLSQPWPNGQKVTVRLAAGVKAAGVLPLSTVRQYQWSFTVEAPLLAYLYPWDQPSQVYLIDPQSGKIQQLTHSTGAVLDYDFDASGSQVYYSSNEANGASALYRLDRPSGKLDALLKCPRAQCRSPKISPKGDLLAYERTDLSGSTPNNLPQVWLLPLGAGTSAPRLAGDPTHRTQQPDWSPSGNLTYYDATLAAAVVLNVQSGERARLPNQAGLSGDWSPDGKVYIYPDIFNSSATISSTVSGVDILPATHLVQYQGAGSSPKDLTMDVNLEDASPAFSPDGSRLAFARRFLDIGRWTPGRQLWVMTINKGNVKQLTQVPFYSHYDFTWSLDSQHLAYARFNNNTLTEPPEIWIINVDGSGDRRLLVGGYAPHFIP